MSSSDHVVPASGGFQSTGAYDFASVPGLSLWPEDATILKRDIAAVLFEVRQIASVLNESKPQKGIENRVEDLGNKLASFMEEVRGDLKTFQKWVAEHETWVAQVGTTVEFLVDKEKERDNDENSAGDEEETGV